MVPSLVCHMQLKIKLKKSQTSEAISNKSGPSLIPRKQSRGNQKAMKKGICGTNGFLSVEWKAEGVIDGECWDYKTNSETGEVQTQQHLTVTNLRGVFNNAAHSVGKLSNAVTEPAQFCLLRVGTNPRHRVGKGLYPANRIQRKYFQYEWPRLPEDIHKLPGHQ